jgi:hypothetical protein
MYNASSSMSLNMSYPVSTTAFLSTRQCDFFDAALGNLTATRRRHRRAF